MSVSKKISGADVRALLEQQQWRLDDELTKQLFMPVYVFTDGSCLVQLESGKDGTLWKTRQDLVDIAFPAEEHLYDRMLGPGRKFIDEIAIHAQRLAEILNLPPSTMDFSGQSLYRLDAVIKNGNPLDFYEPEFFAPLLAYVGETIRCHCGGTWTISSLPNRGGWEPRIIVPGTAPVRPQEYIFRELEEDSGPLIAERVRMDFPELFACSPTGQ